MSDHQIFRFSERLHDIEEYPDHQEQREAREKHDRELEDWLSNVAVAVGPPGPSGPTSDDRYGDLILSMDPVAYWRLGEKYGTSPGDQMLDNRIAYDSSDCGRDARYHTTRQGRWLPNGLSYGDITRTDVLDGLELGVSPRVIHTSDTAARFKLAWVSYPEWPWPFQFTFAFWLTVEELGSPGGDPEFGTQRVLGYISTSENIPPGINDDYLFIGSSDSWFVNPFRVDDTHFDVIYATTNGSDQSANAYINGVGHLVVVRHTMTNVVGLYTSTSYNTTRVDQWESVGNWDTTVDYYPGQVVSGVGAGGWAVCLTPNVGVDPAGDDGTYWDTLSFDSPAFSLSVDGSLVGSVTGLSSTDDATFIRRLFFGTTPNQDQNIPIQDPVSYVVDEVAAWFRPITAAEEASLYAFRK